MSDEKKLTISIQAKNLLGRGLSKAKSSVASFSRGLSSSFDAVGKKIFSLKTAIGAFAGFAAARLVIKPAADFQSIEAQFRVLLGSSEAAKERLEELAEFAAGTNFKLPQIAKASKILESLTEGALSTGEGLTKVGDAAAFAGVGIDEMAVTVGRLFSGLKSGRPVGEPLARLQELGVITGEARNEIERLSKAGKGLSDTWPILVADTKRFDGVMKESSKTLNGLVGTLEDNASLAFKDLGEGSIVPLSKAVEELTKELQKMRESGDLEKFGKDAGQGLGSALRALIKLTAFIKENKETIKNLGLTLAGIFVINKTAAAVAALASNVAAIKVAAVAGSAGLGFLLGKKISKELGIAQNIIDEFAARATAKSASDFQKLVKKFEKERGVAAVSGALSGKARGEARALREEQKKMADQEKVVKEKLAKSIEDGAKVVNEARERIIERERESVRKEIKVRAEGNFKLSNEIKKRQKLRLQEIASNRPIDFLAAQSSDRRQKSRQRRQDKRTQGVIARAQKLKDRLETRGALSVNEEGRVLDARGNLVSRQGVTRRQEALLRNLIDPIKDTGTRDETLETLKKQLKSHNSQLDELRNIKTALEEDFVITTGP